MDGVGVGSSVLIAVVGFIDVAKWVVAIESGSNSHNSLLFLLLLYNSFAIFCHYLATSIPIVTKKNLAQICCEEYSSSACFALGVQAQISIIVSDITNILGIAHGINLVSGIDLFTSTIFAAAIATVLPLSLQFLETGGGVLCVPLSGGVLLLYVFGVLILHSQLPLLINDIFPRLNADNSYLIMALLGSSITLHNLYTHSTIVQKQRGQSNAAALGPLLYDQFFAILIVFSGIFLANCVLMNSATLFTENTAIVTLQDIFLLMDQMLNIHVPPMAFFLVLTLSSVVIAFMWDVREQVIFQSFFGCASSDWSHIVWSKLLAVVPAVYYAQSAGAEGLYQLLIFCQVLLAMLLPSSVIPLFRVASSKQVMGAFSISWYLELFALFTFIWIFASNIIFVVELLFGSSSWITNLSSSLMLSFVTLVLVGCVSLTFTLYMMVTPLKSASDASYMQIWDLQGNDKLVIQTKENELKNLNYSEGREIVVEPAVQDSRKSSVSVSSLDLPEAIADYDKNAYQSTSISNIETASTSSMSDAEQASVVDVHLPKVTNKVFYDDVPDSGFETRKMAEIFKNEVSSGVAIHKPEIKESVASDYDGVSTETTGTSECTELPGSSKVRGSDIDSGSESLSRLSGLGRAGRRQFSAILDEFWGHLFDFHGKLTQEASANKVDILLGMDLRNINSLRTDAGGNEALRRHLPEMERGLPYQTYSRDRNLPGQSRIPSRGMTYNVPNGSQLRLPDRDLFHSCGHNSYGDQLELEERRYSSLHLPQYSNSQGHQPATIHGYQMSSYLQGFGAGRCDTSVISEPKNMKTLESLVSNYRDSLRYTREQDRFGPMTISGFESPSFPRISKLQDEKSYYDPITNYENTASSEKRYHSLPDIYRRTVSSRNSSLSDRNALHGSGIDPRESLGRMSFDRSPSLGQRSDGVPLTFDELSPSRVYKDIFSPQSSSHAETKSLWSRQPFEQLFGMSTNPQHEDIGAADEIGIVSMNTSYVELETKLVESLKGCIVKLLKLEGSNWLIREKNGPDEELIARLILKEKFLHDSATKSGDYEFMSTQEHSLAPSTPNIKLNKTPIVYKCGESCVWRSGLIVSFGVWCIRRILELSLVESRPELWGKYTYVLNRLQGILELAFSKPRSPAACSCLEIPAAYYEQLSLKGIHPSSSMGSAQPTTSGMVLEIIKDVELAISSRKGRTGTAAGDVAFPKGKENLASVLKRYKRRLSNKTSSTQQGGVSSRKVPLPTPPVLYTGKEASTKSNENMKT